MGMTMQVIGRIALAAFLAIASVSTAGSSASAAEPTCSNVLDIAVHGEHIVGDYVTGIGHGDLAWPPRGGVVGRAVAGEGVALAGGPGPGFHFPNDFAPGASFCNAQSKSPGSHVPE